MQRLVIDGQLNSGTTVSLTSEQAHYVRDVMRMRGGETLWVTDGCGGEGTAIVQRADREAVLLEVQSFGRSAREANVHVTVGQGMPKADKLELVIQKCTELGAVAVWPLDCARSVAQVDAKKEARKLERWNKIALEAAEQSHRAVVPVVSAPQSIKTLAKRLAEFDAIFVAAEAIGHEATSESHGLRSALKRWRERHAAETVDQAQARTSRILVLVGPEGGWTEAELQMLTDAGAVAVGLGNRILRTETAALVALSAIYYEFGEYGG